MIKNIFTVLLMALIFMQCGSKHEKDHQRLSFKSSDKKLEKAFQWVRQTAQGYRGDSTDPVGPWYEAALPAREAFCMRDVAHMCIGAEMLGMHAENKNMFLKFAGNISKSKDWCTYWEINRYDKPAPEDYRNDQEFWYNLPANFDLIDAAFRMFKFTGDSGYIFHPVMENFIKRSMNEYVEHWDLTPERIMNRKRFMHQPENFNPDDVFHACRGLPGYVESVPELRLGADLIVAEYAAFVAASEVALINRDFHLAQHYLDEALDLKFILNKNWWDEENDRYHMFLFLDNTFRHGEGEAFLLRYGITDPGFRTEKTLQSLLDKTGKMNIETRSYLPVLLFGNGLDSEGYDQLLQLTDPGTPRRDYPEVSFTAIESLVSGLMGVEADATKMQVSTLSHLKDTTKASIRNLKLMGEMISVFHNGKKQTRIKNEGSAGITWKACFEGIHSFIYVNQKPFEAVCFKSASKAKSYVLVEVEPEQTIHAGISKN